MSIINNSIRVVDIKWLWELICHKILGDKVVCNYLDRVRESFSIRHEDCLLIEWSIRDWVDTKGQKCCETGYLPLSDILEKVEEKDYISLCKSLVSSFERIYYDAYHSDKNSDAFPIDFMMYKVRRYFLI